MIKSISVVLALGGAGALTVLLLHPRAADADGAPTAKNLQVLPKTMAKDQVKAVMKRISRDLGVECDHCHDVPDMASDKNEHKKLAREMLRMTAELNAKWINKLAPKAEVTCNTCHRGEAKPKKGE